MKALFLFCILLLSRSVFGQYSDTISCISQFEYAINYDQQTCPNVCNGNYNINVINGVGPFVYSITGPASYTNSSNFDSNLCPGTYTAFVTDVGLGATCSHTFTILSLSPNISFLTNSVGTGNAPCNGIATINLSGGVPPYTYQWYDSNQNPLIGQTANFIDSMCAGTYYVQYWDNTPLCGGAAGGVGSAGSGLVSIVIPYEPIVINIIFTSPPPCPGMFGQFMYTVTGGSGNYTGTYIDPLNGAVIASPNFLMQSTPGNGFLSIADDAGNFASTPISITGWPAITITPVPTNETCNTMCDGSFFFNDAFSPGIDLYSIDGGLTYQSSPYFYNLCPGSYNTYAKVPDATSGSPSCPISLGSFSISAGNSNSIGTDVQTHCGSFTWSDGIQYTSSNNTATDTLTNILGCDSIVTLNLTITNPSIGTDTQTACDSYTWIDGNTYTTNNNSATWTLQNAQSCDSVITLDLTILNSSSGIDVQSSCDSLVWIDGNTYTSSTNSPTWTLTNSAGCDSTVTLNLTIHQSDSSIQNIAACNNYIWIDGNVYNTSTNSPTWVVPNMNGCDSIINLNLTIISADASVTPIGDIDLTANSNTGTYQWVDCDNNFAPIAGATSQNFAASSNGNYALIVTNNGCSDTSACFLISKVGLNENDFGSGFKVYPNPTQGNLKIDLGAKYSEIITKVFDAKGKLISENSYTDKQTFDIAVEGSRGIYFLEINTRVGLKARVEVIKE